MKSLNRTLSLVLVLAMCLGLMGVASAASFTDGATVKYTEAVDVVSSIGVINGLDTGAFNPAGNLTREQAAKIICYLTLGKTAADALKATTAPFSDVAADRWSAGSIAYCVSQGYVSGMGDGTFAPTANVTGYQFAKMLLCALGYDAKIEGFTGSSWAIAVAKVAFTNNLFNGNDAFNGNNAATREEAALYTLNTLLAKPVSYASKGTSIVVNGTTITTGATAATASTKTFAETYFSTLVNTTGTDSLGRPARVWTLKGVQIGAYAKTPAFSTTADMNYTAGIASLTASLNGKSFASLTKNNVYYNNKPEGASGTSAIASVADLAAKTGNGTKVDVYTDSADATKIVNVSITKTDLVKVAAVNTANKSVTLTTVSKTPVQGSYTVTDLASSKLYAALKDLAVDTLVVVTPAWNGTNYSVAAVAMPKTVSGYITTVNTATGTISLDGKGYDIAAAQTAAVDAAAPSGTVQATLVLDTYGYIVHSTTATVATKNYMYVIDAYSTLANSKIVPMAKGVLTDGTIVDVVNDGTNTLGIKKISAITNDIYTLASDTAGTPAGAAIAPVKTLVALDEKGVINAYDKYLTRIAQDDTDATANYYTNYYSTNVKFVYINTTAKTATVKSGVQAVASIPVGSFAVVERNSATDATPVVTAVYLVDGVAATVDSTSLLYFPASTTIGTSVLKNSSTGKYETFNLFKAYINGAPVDGGVATTATSVTADGFYSYAKSDTTGAYVLSPYTLTTGTSAVISNKPITATFSNSLITVNGKVIDISGAVFADVRTSAEQATKSVILNAAGVCAGDAAYGLNVSVVYNTTTGKAATVYVTPSDGVALAATTVNGNGLTVTATPDKAVASVGETVTFTVTVTGTAAAAGTVTTSVVTGGTATIVGTATNATKTSNTVMAITGAGATSLTYTYSYTVAAAGGPTFTAA